MSPALRELIASVNGQAVGMLRDEGGFWTFEYDPAWLDNPVRFAISPGLPLQAEKIIDTGSMRPVQWQQRLINAIVAMPIKEMSARLRP